MYISEAEQISNPVVIGGLGGSGTRLIVQCLSESGFYIGGDLNQASDNLWFTLLFKNSDILRISDKEFGQLMTIFLKGMRGSELFNLHELDILERLSCQNRLQHSSAYLTQRVYSLWANSKVNNLAGHWGWKEPNTHIVLHRLLKCFPEIKYIHVVRNGLDMAFSKNQNQLKFWGSHFYGRDVDVSAHAALNFWCKMNKRILDIGKTMHSNFLFLNYEHFCLKPEDGLDQLLEFADVSQSSFDRSVLLRLIKTPNTIGRFRAHDLTVFNQEDIDYVAELGFPIVP